MMTSPKTSLSLSLSLSLSRLLLMLLLMLMLMSPSCVWDIGRDADRGRGRVEGADVAGDGGLSLGTSLLELMLLEMK